MSNLERCPVCNEFIFSEHHKCKPIYFFKHPNWGDNFQTIRATSFEDAAEEFARLYNEKGDYSLMGNSEEVIISDGKEEKKFLVSAEPDINYSVKEKQEGEE